MQGLVLPTDSQVQGSQDYPTNVDISQLPLKSFQLTVPGHHLQFDGLLNPGYQPTSLRLMESVRAAKKCDILKTWLLCTTGTKKGTIFS